MPEKKEIIDLLESISDMMEFKGENKFKVIAYRNGASSIRKSEDIEQIIAEKNLSKVKGIGKGLQSVIYEYADTGESSIYNELKKEVPDGIEELLHIKGLGAKRIYQLYNDMGIKNLSELEQACKDSKLSSIKGFGESTQKRILVEIEKHKHNSKFVLLHAGLMFSEEMETKLSSFKSIKKISSTGEARRRSEIISALNFVLLTDDVKKLTKELSLFFEFGHEKNIIIIRDYFSIPVTLHLTFAEEEFAAKLFLTTGSNMFLSVLKIDENKINGSTEEQIFKSISLSYIIPEMREAEALKYGYDKDRSTDLDISLFKGLLHFHTTYSDGRNTLNEMIDAAIENNFSYAAVCDHSKSAFYANGLKEERATHQHKEIEVLNKSKKNIKIFKGIESDILEDGALDYSNEFLANFDFVVASIHSRFSMDEAAMTKRIIRAIENPYTDILGHPSGRLLLSRDPYKFDVKKIIDACAANDVAIEINSNPRRLDIDWRHIFYAKEKGCLFSINPDAHSTAEIDLIKYGIMMGRKGGIQSSEVINCYNLKKFEKYLQRKVKRNLK